MANILEDTVVPEPALFSEMFRVDILLLHQDPMANPFTMLISGLLLLDTVSMLVKKCSHKAPDI